MLNTERSSYSGTVRMAQRNTGDRRTINISYEIVSVVRRQSRPHAVFIIPSSYFSFLVTFRAFAKRLAPFWPQAKNTSSFASARGLKAKPWRLLEWPLRC